MEQQNITAVKGIGEKIREYIGMKERQDAGISPLTCLISYL